MALLEEWPFTESAIAVGDGEVPLYSGGLKRSWHGLQETTERDWRNE